MNEHDKQSLRITTGIFLDKMEGRRNIDTDGKKELVGIWKRLTGETIWCLTCSAVISDLYKKVKNWHAKEIKAIEADDALLKNYDLAVHETGSSYTPKKKKSDGNKSKRPRKGVLRADKKSKVAERSTDAGNDEAVE